MHFLFFLLLCPKMSLESHAIIKAASEQNPFFFNAPKSRPCEKISQKPECLSRVITYSFLNVLNVSLSSPHASVIPVSNFRLTFILP